jgi:hypothetical protein
MPRHFGILIPSTNTTCEIEFCRLPSELQVHTGRLGKGGNTPFSPSMDADVVHEQEARIAALERLVGRQAPELSRASRSNTGAHVENVPREP